MRQPPPPPPPAALKEPADLTCPTPLGIGVKTNEAFCDVMTGRSPADGVIDQTAAARGSGHADLRSPQPSHVLRGRNPDAQRVSPRYTATIGVLTMDNTLVSRAVVQSEFRTAADLVDRVGGAAGPGGMKAVAPTGTESIAVTVPQGENEVSLLGEKLTVERPDETTATYTQPGRPIADVSNVMVEYRPPPVPAPPLAPAKT